MDQGDRNFNDSSCSYQQKKNPSECIDKIISLLEHQITRNDTKRLVHLIREYLWLSQNGFLVRDLFNVIKLAEILAERINEQDEYSSLLKEILKICSKPPILLLSSDVLTFKKDIQEYFFLFGYLLANLKNLELQLLVAETLSKLLKDEYCARWYLPLHVRMNLVEGSQLSKVLGKLLEIVDESLYSKILNILYVLSKDSDQTCKVLVEQDVSNYIITRLEPTWEERLLLNKRPAEPTSNNLVCYEEMSKLLWTLLNYLTLNKEVLPNVNCINLQSLWSLKYAFRIFTLETYTTLDRNNIMAIILKLLELFPEIDFVKSGIAEVLLAKSRSKVHQTRCQWPTFIKFPISDDDFTFMKMMLICLPYYMNYIGGIRISKGGNLSEKQIKALIILLQNDQELQRSKFSSSFTFEEAKLLEYYRIVYKMLSFIKNIHSRHLSRSQTCSIIIYSLYILKKTVPHMEEEFIENNGPVLLLNIIERYETSESDINILKRCLEVLLEILREECAKNILTVIIFNDGLKILLDLCHYFLSHTLNDNNKEISLAIAFQILNILYKNSTERDGTEIDLIINYMKRILDPHSLEIKHDERVIIAIMDFTWQHIIKDEKESAEFVKKNGAYLMLDMIQAFSSSVQLIILSALIDLCEYGKCIPYLITWRGNGQTIIPLLLRLFREENKRRNVKRGRFGEMLDVKYPLMGNVQWMQTFCKCSPLTRTKNPAMADLFLSCRPKVYALLQMLNDRYKEEVEIANEHYKLYNIDDLEPADQITMLVASNFLGLKLGEAWNEVKLELKNIPITPLSSDEIIIDGLIQRFLKWATHLQKIQTEILERCYEKDLIEEQKLFNLLGESRLSNALQALSDLKYIARSSENMFRISQKYKHSMQIENAVRTHAGDDVPHRTYFTALNVTQVFGQQISIESNVIYKKEEPPIEPVSPTVSSKGCENDIPEDLLDCCSEIKCDPFQ